MFCLAKSWKERSLQIQAVKDKCNHILTRLALPDDDARAQGIIHIRQFCNTLAAVPIKLQQNAEIRRKADFTHFVALVLPIFTVKESFLIK